jgi:hypothetical protein
MNLGEFQSLIHEPLDEVYASVIEVVVRFDAEVEYLPQKLFTSGAWE